MVLYMLEIDNPMKKYLSTDLLIIDDVGLSPLNSIQVEHFYEIVSESHIKSSIIITSNRPPQDWIALLLDLVMANSALNQLAHHLIMEGIIPQETQTQNQQRLYPKRRELTW